MSFGMFRGPLRVLAAIGVLAFNAGCSGSGERAISTPSPAPSPTPTPTPSPTPTPTSTNFITPEVERSDGPQFHGAIAAWERGVSGVNSLIAVVDTGIDQDSPEFAGRIHPASTDVAGERGFEAEDDHGTNVSMVAAAARNDAGIVGVAYEADVLALRVDTPGTCGTDTPDDPSLGCSFYTGDIARSIDIAVGAGATVINLSLGGSDPGATVTDAVSRAAAAGVIIVVASGNYGDGSAPEFSRFEPTPFASAISRAGQGNVIIVGSVDEGGRMSSFSNPAGDELDSYIAARGERICCVYEDGEIFVGTDERGDYTVLFSGTSFAAPQVAGAVALLKQAFPNLSGSEIVELLLESATDAGDVGVDRTYGRGILSIANAFKPSGAMTIASTNLPVSQGNLTAIGSHAMGDALSQTSSIIAISTDKYDRAFKIDLSKGLRSSGGTSDGLRSALAPGGRRHAASSSSLALGFTVVDFAAISGREPVADLLLSHHGGKFERVSAGRILTEITPGVRIGFSFNEGANRLQMQASGSPEPNFLMSRSARTVGVIGAQNSGAAAVGFDLGNEVEISFGFEAGDVLVPGHDRLRVSPSSANLEAKYTQAIARVGYASVGWKGSVGFGWIDEQNSILGGWFGGAIGGAGANTMLVDASVSHELPSDWRIGVAAIAGATRADRSGLISDNSLLTSASWSVDLMKGDVFASRDSLGIQVSQPLRVEEGGINLRLPVSYDYSSESASFASRFISLEPSSREIVSELRWSGPLGQGWGGATLFFRRHPDHLESQSSDFGAAASYRATF
ncbi:S8 family peptidase [Qipengyuania aquimaris]|uniref:S8 family serine peptidase n=1 Tax=Qipengyuania aquimaris TaxID=255984 RepID=A0A9Q3S0K3_9SPHN|nr:S8 family peptidase [Qipengyuania aquimaris]MBY6217903.1 S8 family serine peptidase [Qipengyuania aquimaris]